MQEWAAPTEGIGSLKKKKIKGYGEIREKLKELLFMDIVWMSGLVKTADHGFPDKHSIPHDHIIRWDSKRGSPIFVKPAINYKPENYPNGAPEFKEFMKSYIMKKDYDILKSSPEENRFHTISEFKWCMHDGGEVEFEYRGKHFSIIHPEEGILIGEIYKPETRKICANSNEILEYSIDGVRLKDVITQVKVLARTI